MWLITNFGFFSIVQKPDDGAAGTLTVRARVKSDLETLRERYLPNLGPISPNAGTDYKYRATAPRDSVAVAILEVTRDVDYSNFKSSVAKKQGHQREKAYHKVWDVLYELQDDEPSPPAKKESKAVRLSYGGVLFNDQGRVLLREPTGHFDGYAWTFPKGQVHEGEPAVNVALREVLEETGYRAEVICRIPRVFQGGTGENVYLVMRPVGEPVAFDPAETAAVRWATPDEARKLIAQTTNKVGRERDLAVLEAAIETYAEHGGSGNRA